MKIKRIISLCKARKEIIIMHTESGKMMWVSDGCAAYPMYSIPVMNPEDILQMHDIPEDESINYSMREKALVFNPDYPRHGEAMSLDEIAIKIEMSGIKWRPFICRETNRVYYIDSAYLAPLEDNKQEKTYWLKYNLETGVPIVMVYAGMTVLAAIAPQTLNWEAAYMIYTLLMADAERKAYKETVSKKEPEPEQTVLNGEESGGAERSI